MLPSLNNSGAFSDLPFRRGSIFPGAWYYTQALFQRSRVDRRKAVIHFSHKNPVALLQTYMIEIDRTILIYEYKGVNLALCRG